jgi:dTDP-4-amino-4,6-dideoxygalactose transaminase
MFGNERELVDEAFASNYIAPCGPMVERFEQALAERTQVPHVCALSSCTAGLDLLFYELDIGKGDRVFCSNLTFVASIAPAAHRGAMPVFIGSDEGTWTMSPELLSEALRDAERDGVLPKAVVAVDLYGQCCDYDAIEGLCAQYGVPLIVDAAEALGAVYYGSYCDHSVIAMESVEGKKERNAGDAGWAGVFSFNGNKIITSSGGGALVSHDAEVVRRALKSSQQSRESAMWYEHCELGYNYRMSNIVAAIGLGQLYNLEKIIEKKRTIFTRYHELLSDCVDFMPEAEYGIANRWLTVALLPKDDGQQGEPSNQVMRVIRALEERNIESRPVWKPMHMQPVFSGCKVYGERVDQEIFERGICLPSGIALEDYDIERVARIVSLGVRRQSA